jgi:rSAM/selenodomain-associated transferase 1
MNNLLLIYAKEPKAGLVKTRLAKDIGAELAADLYRAFLVDIVNNVRDDKNYESRIMCTPESSIANLRALLSFDNIHYQTGDTLTDRLGSAFFSSFEEGYKKVVAIGTDSPLITRDVIADSFSRLDDKDCVIGPTKDGGYYLVGLKKYTKNIFNGIFWSTDQVFSQTMERLRELDFTSSTMEMMSDIDELDDLIAFKRNYDNLPENEKERTENLYNILMGNNFFREAKREIL